MSQLQTLMHPKSDEPKSAIMEGQMRYSAITFHVDMTKPCGLVIPIGVMAEILFPTIYALGLIARTELSADELAVVSDVSKPIASKPFAYLATQFNEAWDALAPGRALRGLAEKHAYSALHFSVPETTPFYQLPAPLSAPLPMRATVRMFLGTLLDERMQTLIQQMQEPANAPQQQASPQQELLQLKAKAAAA